MRRSTRAFGLQLFLVSLIALAGLASPHSSPAAAQAQSGRSYLAETWSTGFMGLGIGLSQISGLDIDQDGVTELVVDAQVSRSQNAFWFIASYNPSEAAYRPEYMSRGYPARAIARIAVAPLDGGYAIYVALADGTVEVYDATTRELRYTLFSGVSPARAVAIADLNQDGAAELVVGGASQIAVFDQVSYAARWRIDVGVADLAIANVDADPALELVTTTAVIDGATRASEWSYGPGFGARIGLGDLDGDGRAEIVGAASQYYVRAFNAVTQTMTWELSTNQEVTALLVTDVNADGAADIVYGDGQIGSVHAYDGATRAALWSIANPEHGVTALAFADADADGAAEIIWGAGWTSPGRDQLIIADPATRTIEWRSLDTGGPFKAMDVGDLDGDGDLEIAMVSVESDNTANDGILFIFDATTHRLEWQSPPLLNGRARSRIHCLSIADVDGDGGLDIIIATADNYQGVLLAYDGATRDLLWQTPKIPGVAFITLTTADLDGDGSLEVIGSDRFENASAVGSAVRIFDGVTGAAEWSIPVSSVTTPWADAISAGDLDGDGRAEITFSAQGLARVYSGSTRTEIWRGGSEVKYVSHTDTDGDGRVELLLGTLTGWIYAYDGVTFALRWALNVGSDSITAARYADLDNDGAPELVVTDYASYLYVFDGTSRTRIWKSPLLGIVAGLGDHLVVADIDADNRTDILFGDAFALRQFSYNLLPFTAGAQVAPASAQPGATVAYTFRLRSYAASATPLTMRIPLAAGLSIRPEDLQPSQGTAAIVGGQVVWEVADARAADQTLRVTARVAPDLPDGRMVVLRATVSDGTFSLDRSVGLLVDAIAPTSQILEPAAGALLSGAQTTIRGTAADRRSGIARVEVQIDDGPWQRATGTTSWSLLWSLPQSDAPARIRVRAVDTAGNVEGAGVLRDVFVDNLAPRVIATVPAHGARMVDRTAPFAITFSEPVQAASLRVSCQTDPGGMSVALSGDGLTATVAHMPLAPDQLYSCVVTEARDRAGRSLAAGSVPNPWSFATAAPISPVAEAITINGGALSTGSPEVVLRIDGYDPDGPVAALTMRLSNDGQSWGAWQAYARVTPWSLAPGQGLRTVYVQLRDEDSNLSAVTSATIELDAGADSYAVTIDSGALCTNQESVVLSISARPGTAAMQISNDGGFAGATWEPYRSTRAWALRPRGSLSFTRVVYVRFRDTAGAISATYSDDILLDTEQPSVALRFQRSGEGSFLLIDAHDGVSGVAKMRIGASPTLSGASWVSFQDRLPWPGGGMIYVQLVDRAGNPSAIASISPPSGASYRVLLPLIRR